MFKNTLRAAKSARLGVQVRHNATSAPKTPGDAKPTEDWDSKAVFPNEQAAGAPTEHKDEMIFNSILNSVLNRAQKSTGGHKTMTAKVQAIFDKPQTVNTNLRQEYGSVLDRRTKDLVNQSKPRQNVELDKVRPVLEYIQQLDSNKQVIDFFRFVVVPAFKSAKPVALADGRRGPPVTGNNIGFITEATIAALIEDFNDPVGALYVFNLIKGQSIELFVAACSPDVYNLIIAMRWQYYRDLHSVLKLVNEMFINAIQGNDKTVDLLGIIHREAVDCRDGVPGADQLPLWSSMDDTRAETLSKYRVRMMTALAAQTGYALGPQGSR